MEESQSSLTNDQLHDLARAAGENALDLISDARLLLDADRFPRAYALAVLALEEVGKVELCGEVVAGELDQRDFRREWRHHDPKLWRAHLPGILLAPSADRVFADPKTDHVSRLRGLYVDFPATPGDPPHKPADITPAEAREIVVHVELIVDSYRHGGWQARLMWLMELRSSTS